MITCNENSSPFGIADVFIPADVQYLSFDFSFTDLGDGDYASISLDSNPLWIFEAAAAEEGKWRYSGLIPVVGLQGQRNLTVQLHGEGDTNVEFAVRDFRTTSVLPPVDGAPLAVDDAATTYEDEAVRIAVLANDSNPGGDTL